MPSNYRQFRQVYNYVATRTINNRKEEVKLSDSAAKQEAVSDYQNECVGCKEDYQVTKRKYEWL